MARSDKSGDLLKCSFCGKSLKQVKKLIAGPGVYICDACIVLCNEIIEEELSESSDLKFGRSRLVPAWLFGHRRPWWWSGRRSRPASPPPQGSPT